MIPSVTRRSSFAAVRQSGQRARSGPVSVRFAPVEPCPTIAFTIGKRFGNAVERNRARRRLRAAFTELDSTTELPAGAYVISSSRAVLTCDYQQLTRALTRCCEQLAPPTASPEIA